MVPKLFEHHWNNATYLWCKFHVLQNSNGGQINCITGAKELNRKEEKKKTTVWPAQVLQCTGPARHGRPLPAPTRVAPAMVRSSAPVAFVDAWPSRRRWRIRASHPLPSGTLRPLLPLSTARSPLPKNGPNAVVAIRRRARGHRPPRASPAVPWSSASLRRFVRCKSFVPRPSASTETSAVFILGTDELPRRFWRRRALPELA